MDIIYIYIYTCVYIYISHVHQPLLRRFLGKTNRANQQILFKTKGTAGRSWNTKEVEKLAGRETIPKTRRAMPLGNTRKGSHFLGRRGEQTRVYNIYIYIYVDAEIEGQTNRCKEFMVLRLWVLGWVSLHKPWCAARWGNPTTCELPRIFLKPSANRDPQERTARNNSVGLMRE